MATEKQTGDKKVPRLTKARAAKPKGPLIKKLLLAMAVLFLVAGGAWQYLTDMSVNGQNREIERTEPRPGEMPQVEVVRKKSPPPEDPRRTLLETNQKQPGPDGKSVPPKTVAAVYEKPAQTTPIPETQKNLDQEKRPETGALEKKVKTESSADPENTAGEIRSSVDAPQREIGPPDSARYPYSILLASFKQATGVERLTKRLKTEGINPYWVKVDLGSDGIWYRVFVGFYQDLEKARLIIEQNNWPGALPKSTRFAAWIGGFTNRQDMEKEIDKLSTKGFSAYSIADDDQIAHLFVGAFFTRKGAETQSAILKDAGIESMVVER